MSRSELIELTPSPRLAMFCSALHLLGGSALWLSAVPFSAQLALTGVLLWQCIYLIRRYAWLAHAKSVKALRWNAKQWFVQLGGGAEIEVNPAATSRLYRRGGVLRWDQAGCRGWRSSYWLILLGDGAAPESIRRLRVRLLHCGSSQS